MANVGRNCIFGAGAWSRGPCRVGGDAVDHVEFLPQGSEVSASRRRVLLAPLVAAVTLAMARTAAQAGRIDPTPSTASSRRCCPR